MSIAHARIVGTLIGCRDAIRVNTGLTISVQKGQQQQQVESRESGLVSCRVVVVVGVVVAVVCPV
jgi:hypothetical protein